MTYRYYSGAILDVSDSMQYGTESFFGGKWVRALLDAIDDLVTHDVSNNHKVLAIGAGARRMENEAFDVIKTIALFQNDDWCDFNWQNARYETITAIFNLLERHGAKRIRQWVDLNLVCSVVTENEARLVLRKLNEDSDFTRTFVCWYLPESCRDWNWVDETDTSVMGFFGYHLKRVQSSVYSSFRQATRDEISDVVKKAMSYLLRVRNDSAYPAHEAADILRGTDGGERLSPERAEKLHRKMKPYIYGTTPLYSALNKAANLFPSIEVDGKYLFVFSYGEPSDYGSVDTLKSIFEKRSISVIGCYMSTLTGCTIKPKQLYSTVGPDWDGGARFLFGISSMVPTHNVPRAIFINNGWDIDITKEETKLFLHINNPENIRSAVDVVKKAMDSKDSLLDLIAHVSVEKYIKSRIEEYKVPIQEGKTSYANAAATVMHLAMVRIHGREDGYPEFESLRREIIDEFEQGADTMKALQNICPKYRLHCKAIGSKEAMKAVFARRPVIARFELTGYEWTVFNNIFTREPKKILSEEDIHISRSSSNKIGHAVVLTSYNSDSLRLMNSTPEGKEWGDGGFFRIKNADVLGLDFIDVYWTENDLSEPEKQQYRQHGLDIASKYVNYLKVIKNGIYSCPLCKITSKISEFHGTMSTAVCPKCKGKFDSYDGEGNIIAMNIYLTSLNN